MITARRAAPPPGSRAREDGDRVTDDDVLRRLRTETAPEHQAVEATLDLLSPTLTRARLVDVLTRMHGFWQAAETGLDGWARTHRSDAERVGWPARRRSALFAADLGALGAPPAEARPQLPDVPDTDAALGRLYV